MLPGLELLGQVHDHLERDDVEIETVASLIERYGVTHLQCTPSLASMLMADPTERAALGRLRHRRELALRRAARDEAPLEREIDAYLQRE